MKPSARFVVGAALLVGWAAALPAQSVNPPSSNPPSSNPPSTNPPGELPALPKTPPAHSGKKIGNFDRPLVADLPARYLEAYLALFPSRATAVGDHRYDRLLEDLSEVRLLAWLRYNKNAIKETDALLRLPEITADQRLDYQVVGRQARRVVLELEALKRPQHDPLYWTQIFGDAATYLLLRDDRPLDKRLFDLGERIALLPNLTQTAYAVLAHGDPARRVPDFFDQARAQSLALAAFYRGPFQRRVDELPPGKDTDRLRERLSTVGERAAVALEQFAERLAVFSQDAGGTWRLGPLYRQVFRVGTGLEESIESVQGRAERALVEKRREAAEFCRDHWSKLQPELPLPETEEAIVKACFDRIGQEGAGDLDEFVADYRQLTLEAKAFVEKHQLMTLPPGLSVQVDRSPAYLAGAAVGGISPPGPFSPEGPSLLMVPTPPDSATPEQKAAFFRDFNHPFNVMITPHETVPGHAAQMTLAARGPSRLRAIFADGVYVEGWGTFSERLMLDAGWGDEFARVAHLKKQLENIARVLVDIRVHTQNLSEEGVLALVRGQALQDEQFARNMWRRAQTTAPQITTYWLGYQEIWQLYQKTKAERGEAFVIKEFTDAMMSLGPVPIRHYQEVLKAKPQTPCPEAGSETCDKP